MHHREVHCSTVAGNARQASSKEELRKSIPNTVISRSGLVELSKEMVDWKCYAYQLGISQAKQREIESDYRELSEQKFQLLWTWKQQKGREATWGAFISACIALNDDHLREEAIRLCK